VRMADRRHIVITDQTHGLPYSKGLMASSLMSSGLGQTRAFQIAERIEETLIEQGRFEVTGLELRDLAASLLAEAGPQYADTYLKWQAVEELDLPLIVLLGGATGVGKSTLATLLAVRLGITRVISTDAVREVLRSVFSMDLMPTLHSSSYEADSGLRIPLPPRTDRVITGFREQVSAVAVGIKALIGRSVEEGTDIIIEGAHVVPGFLQGWDEEFKDAVIVPIVVTVSDEMLHRSHFQLRGLETRWRPRDRYLSAFGRIRSIQSYINRLAVEHAVPVVEIFDLDSALKEIVSIVVEKALEKAQTRASAPVPVEAPLEAGALVKMPPDEKEGQKQKTSRLKSWQVLGGRRKS
jgi:2-phosphoglycerate kinase